jgi:hypothetical protein
VGIKNVIPNASTVLFRRAYYTSPYLLKPNFRLGGDLLLWANIMIGRSIVYKPQLSIITVFTTRQFDSLKVQAISMNAQRLPAGFLNMGPPGNNPRS